MKAWQKFFLVFILIVAMFVRFYRLGEIPEGFHADEAAFGYNAYSILKTGRDEYGKLFPLALKSFGDQKPALYSYITIPFIAIFGLTEKAVRMPSSLFGILLIYCVYVTCFTITKRKDLSLFAAIVAALSPTLIVQSRVQSNPIISFATLLLALTWYLKWVNTKKTAWLLYSFGALLFSSFSYLTPQHFMPFMLPYLLWKDRKRFTPRMWGYIGIYITAFLIIIFWQAKVSGTRYGQISVLSHPQIILPLEEQIREDGVSNTPVLAARLFHNKLYAYLQYMTFTTEQYLSYDFLFHEAKQPLREKIPSVGMLYFGELFLLCIGLISFIRKPPAYTGMLIAWLIASVAGLSITIDETPNIHRFLMGLFPLFIVISEGIRVLVFLPSKIKGVKIKPGLGWGLVILCYAGSLLFFLHQLFVHQPKHVSYFRDFPYKPLIATLKKYYDSYDQIIFTKGHGSPYIHILFWWPYDPASYQSLGSPRDMDDGGFDKYIFVPHACPSLSKKYFSLVNGKKTLFIDKAECPVNPDDILEKVYWGSGAAAFYLVEPHYTEEEIMKLL